MGLLSFRPTRDDAKEGNGDIFADLDLMISRPIRIKCLGRVHTIKPITNLVFFEVTEGLSRIDRMRSTEKFDKDEFLDAYGDLFSKVCDTIGRSEVERMEWSQRGALLQLILDLIRGRTGAQDLEKKKTLMESKPNLSA